jgi:signal peptidase
MAPALPRGTLIVVRPSDDVGLGDVVTFQLRSGEPEVATHRVVGVGTTVNGEPVYTTKGDANDVADVEQVAAVQVRGELWYHVPFLGYVAALLTGGQRQGIAVAGAAALAAYAAWQVVQARRERRRRSGDGAATPGSEEADAPPRADGTEDRKVAAG